ncbi:MAG: hypothetical protein WBD25_04835 [Terriglobales bacterium]
MTASVVVVLLAIPLVFVLRNFVTFDALDSYLGVTQNVQPKILHNISEELDSGYSRDFFIDPGGSGGAPRVDNTMLFYSTPGQRVSLVAQATEISGPFSTVTFQVDGCSVNRQWDQPFSLLDFDLTKALGQCSSDQPNLHTLRVVLPRGALKGSNMEIKSLVVVYHRVHEHIK